MKAATRLANLLPELHRGRMTHVKWRDYFAAFPDLAGNPEFEKLGDAEFHQAQIEIYDERIGSISEMVRAAASLGRDNEGLRMDLQRLLGPMPDEFAEMNEMQIRDALFQKMDTIKDFQAAFKKLEGCVPVPRETIKSMIEELDNLGFSTSPQSTIVTLSDLLDE